MALNPILNVFQIQLNPTKEEYKTFTDFYNQKFSIQNDEKLLFQSLCAKIIQELGDKEFKKDTISKKVVGVKKTKKLNNTLKLHSDKYILEGIIEGGKYDNLREYADINNKDSRSLLDRNKAVLDLYYIFLYMPLKEDRGYLIIQSYTEESILSSFFNIIKPFFSLEKSFFNLKIINYVPKKFIEEFKNKSSVKMFNFKTILPIGNNLRESQQIKTDAFEVTIELKPLNGKIPVNYDAISATVNAFKKTEFDGKSLSDMDARVYISDSNDKKAHFDIDKQLETIRPTIYLQDKISINQQTGLPDFEQMKTYCFNLLDEIKNEINDIENIDEL